MKNKDYLLNQDWFRELWITQESAFLLKAWIQRSWDAPRKINAYILLRIPFLNKKNLGISCNL
jgi:hypothetical protein